MIRLNHLKTASVALFVTIFVLCTAVVNVRAELSNSRARRALTRMAGFELTSGAVRVRTIKDTSNTTADVTAELRTVFRFEQNQQGRWRVAEVRTAPDRWEDVSLISNALQAQVAADECTVADPPFRGNAAVDPSPKRVRCLLGNLLGIPVPSEAIRIQEVEPFVLPLASESSATIVAWIRVDARAVNDSKSGWRIAEIRTGDRDWVKLDQLITAVNQEKERRVRAEMQQIAEALENYRANRGGYIVTDSHAVVIDHLNPKYLRQVIRLDPWHRPYKYDGQRDRFTLRSTGPDGKEGTADDIARSK